jgi:hypothetical protein
VPGEAGRVGEQRREALHPWLDGDVIYLDTPLGQQFLDVTVREPVAQGPADRDCDHLGRKPKAREG